MARVPEQIVKFHDANDATVQKAIEQAAAPDPVEDGAEPPQLAAPAPQVEQPAAESQPEPQEAKPFVDRARANIAAKIKREREERQARALNTDYIPHVHGATPPGSQPQAGSITDPNDPDFIPDEVDPAAADAQPAAAPTARVEPSAAQLQFKPSAEAPTLIPLKVNGSTFGVTDDQLLQYADCTPEEAAGIPRDKLIALAQKNIAADLRLQNAKNSRQDDRADRQPAATPAAQVQPNPAQRAAPRTPPADTKALVQKIQLGDEEEAAAAIEEYGERLMQTIEQRQHARRQSESIAESHQRGLQEVQSEYPQIFENDVLTGAHTIAYARAVADEVHRVNPLNSAQYAAICNNPALAAQVHTAALSEGVAIARPDEINRRAARTIADSFGLKPQQRQERAPTPPQPPLAPPRRQDSKRAAFTNTARPVSPQPVFDSPAQAPATDRDARRLAVLADMRRARHQA